ncbi:hypothetical protein EOPP23_18720 [Endozoicomonas sp. OPT23]|uniref:FimV/HubP family polar landmark protein n=1 Tax=Endozoicomonas sp. OPT23 TaxID=2072845 RepID=UPI00129ABE4C|nr:FimV/HubP family polar landmark protein [Endozoicomonas sp. OPT23]MRI35013.1 hypothetical protein [Endozoicomonas sp. OPT23]
MRLQKLVAAMAMAGALGSGYVNALGLGEVRLNSALNQPLDAEIELLQVRELTRNEILPNMAAPTDFKRAGLDRPFILSGMKFKTVLRTDGTGFIHVTSSQVIREPFLNFLLEVHWPSGRLLREYTMLLDPPAFSEQPAAPVKPASASNYNGGLPSQQRSTNPFDQRSGNQPPQPQSYQPVQSQAAQPVSSPSGAVQAGQPENYQVKANDNLWNIARSVRPSSDLSVQQTMVALQRKNPDAFIKGNINRLKKGQVLRTPTRDEINQISFQEAVGEVARQQREWQTRLEQLDATRRTSADTGASGGKSDGKLSIVSSEQSSGSGRDLGGGSADADDSGLQNELVMTREKLDKLTRDNEELKSRLKDLDDQISTLKRLISLKDDQLSALQQQPGTDTDVAVTPEPVQPVSAKVEPKPAPVITPPAPTPQPSFIDFLFSNPLFLAIAALIPLGLIGALLVYRRRKQEAEEEDELEAAMLEEPELPVDSHDGMIEEELELDEEALEIDEETLLQEEFDEEPAEETVQQTDDAISEADIYIAYGRFPQAAELLGNAIAAEPQRADLRLKLLEVHAENNDIDNFKVALAGVEQLGDDDAMRQADAFKARFPVEMFAGAATAAVAAGAAIASEPEPSFDIDDSLTIDSDDDDLGSLDFDLDDLDLGEEPAEETAQPAQEEDGLSFDLDNLDDLDLDLDLDLDDQPEAEAPVTQETESDELPDLGDLDFDEPVTAEEDSFDLPDLDLDFDLGEEPEAETAISSDEKPAAKPEPSDDVLSFEDGLPDLEAALDDDLDFLSDDDEAATKLDLARAYIDMGDNEGARDILQEVLEAGTDEQKQEAQSLLDQAQ